jgi:hypothetical protein
MCICQSSRDRFSIIPTTTTVRPGVAVAVSMSRIERRGDAAFIVVDQNDPLIVLLVVILR